MNLARRFLLIAAVAGLNAPPVLAQTSETAVKAAFVAKFPGYVTWPGVAPGQLSLCIVGSDPFGPLAERAAATERAAGRALVVRRMATLAPDAPCQLAFITGSSRQTVRAALAAVANAPILTVTDARRSRDRGVIHFEVSGGRVRFHIDEQRAGRGGMAISSKLLELALSVKRSPQ